MSETVTPAQFAKDLGDLVTDRHVRRLCEAGMEGARKIGQRWKIDPKRARAWLTHPDHASVIANRLPADALDSLRTVARTMPLMQQLVEAADEQAGRTPATRSRLERHVEMLAMVASAAMEAMVETVEPRSAGMLKQLLAELRQGESHLLAMAQAEGSLIERDRHRAALVNLAAIFRTELESYAGSLPDQLIRALTEAGVEVSDQGKALRALGQAIDGNAKRLLTRLADEIEDSDLEDKADEPATAEA